MRDEAEIRGHRRTYIGAMPGRIIQAIRRAGANDPVFMLDEVDKLGNDWRGDPSSALLEVLDPEQNNTFRDHYLDVAFDLSKVMFITTANVLDTDPAAAARPHGDHRAGGLHRGGEAADRAALPDAEAGRRARPARPTLTWADDGAAAASSGDYTREAGVRNLEREIGGGLPQGRAARWPRARSQPTTVTPSEVRDYLGRPRYFYEELAERTRQPGVATASVWTPVGGDIMFIEATAMPGKGALTLTGQLGDVMRESAQAAMSFVALARRASWASTRTSSEDTTSTSTSRPARCPRTALRRA